MTEPYDAERLIEEVPIYRDECPCEPPGHDRGCRGRVLAGLERRVKPDADSLREAATALAAQAEEIERLRGEIEQLRKPRMPRLTAPMIEEAKVAHYGEAARNLEVGLVADSVDWTFEQGFRRMWNGCKSALGGKQDD